MCQKPNLKEGRQRESPSRTVGLLRPDHLRRASCPSIVDRSTTQRVAPTGLHILSVFDDAGHRRVTARILKHLSAIVFVILRVAIDESCPLGIVVVARLLTVRTTWFGVD